MTWLSTFNKGCYHFPPKIWIYVNIFLIIKVTSQMIYIFLPSLSPPSKSQILLRIKIGIVNKLWGRTPIFFRHMIFWSPLLDPYTIIMHTPLKYGYLIEIVIERGLLALNHVIMLWTLPTSYTTMDVHPKHRIDSSIYQLWIANIVI